MQLITQFPTFRASIEWVTREDGGRKHPPRISQGEHYGATASVGNWNGNNSHLANWSVFVCDVEEVSDFRCNATVGYVVREAPHASFLPGTKFELYEGARCVAKGQIIGPLGPDLPVKI
jgi:hypothetical protein